MRLPLHQRSSEADTTFRCHGALLLKPRCPKRKDDEGVEGAAVHYEIARRAIAELGATPPAGGLVRDSQIPNDYKIPAFSAWIVDWGLARIREHIPDGWALMVELELRHRYDLPRPVWVPVSEIIGDIPDDHQIDTRDGILCVRIDYYIATGHLDIFAISPDGKQAKGIDWKTGIVGADEAENNWQAAQYTGLASLEWGDIEETTFILAQPKISEEATGIKRVSWATLKGEQLDRMNGELAEQMNRALEDRYTTDSGPKQCRYCNVGRRCPSIKAELMKATITKDVLEDLKQPEREGDLADFVISGRTLKAPIEDATQALHAIIDAKGYIDSRSGARITRISRPGRITITDKTAFRQKVEQVLPERERQDRCIDWSKAALIDEIADARGIHKKSKKEVDATTIWDGHLAPLTEQAENRILVITT